MKLGKIIRMYIDEHGYSLREFSKICGISPAQMTFMERGVNSDNKPSIPKPETLIKLAAGMGISYRELLGALDKEDRVLIGSTTNGVTLTPEKQDVIDKILMATPEQFSQIKSYVDFVIKG